MTATPSAPSATPTVTKSALLAGRACDLRAYRSLVQGDPRSAPPVTPTGLLVEYRARHLALSRVHRLWQRGGVLDASAVPEVWAAAWRRAGGGAPPDAPDWLRWYSAEDPFHLTTSRRIVACEQTFRATALGRPWSARPDLLCLTGEPDTTLEALEFSSARTPLLDRQAVEAMVAIDLLVLARTPAYALLPHRVLVCGLETGRTYDVTLSRGQARDALLDIDAYLKDIEVRGRAWMVGDAAEAASGRPFAAPSPQACGACAYRGDCPVAWDEDGTGTPVVTEAEERPDPLLEEDGEWASAHAAAWEGTGR